MNICIDTDSNINIDIDNFDTDASTVNSVHACSLKCGHHGAVDLWNNSHRLKYFFKN